MSQQLPSQKPSASTLTLDSVFKAMQHWRNNKSSFEGSGIPDDIWLMFFKLEEAGYASKELRRLFSLNSQQYSKKRHQLYDKPNVVSDKTITPNSVAAINDKDDKPIQFSEAIVASEQAVPSIPPLTEPPPTEASEKTKQAITKLKSTVDKPSSYLDTTTIIVECIRPDGHRLKIHTTNNSMPKIMQAFFKSESEVPTC